MNTNKPVSESAAHPEINFVAKYIKQAEAGCAVPEYPAFSFGNECRVGSRLQPALVI